MQAPTLSRAIAGVRVPRRRLRRTQLRASARASAARRLGALARARRASAAGAVSRSASLPPSPRSESSTATSAAVSPQPALAGLDQHMREARRQRQRGDRRPCAVGRPSSSSAPSACSRAPRLVDRGGGRRIEPAQRARIGDAPDRAIEQQRATDPPPGSRADRSAAGRRSPLPPTGDRRRPAPAAPARPARCVTAAWLARSVTSRVMPGGAIVARPAREPGIDDDADAVERQAGLGDRGREHELAPARRRGAIAARCAAGSRLPCRRWRSTSAGSASSRSAVRSISATPGRKASRPPSALARARGGSRPPSRPRSAPRRRGRDGAASIG